MPEPMHTEDWQSHISRIEQLARAQGLKYHPVEFLPGPSVGDDDRADAGICLTSPSCG